MSGYQSPTDLRLAAASPSLAPAEAGAFLVFDHAAKREGGVLDVRTRELVSLAVALTTQCAYCLDVHTRAAKRAGATLEELAEVVMVAAAVRAGATVGHGLLALRLFDDAAV